MSISSMTNVAFARRKDVEPVDESPNTLNAIAGAKADPPGAQTGTTSALASIATYIPTEVLTVYVAILAAINPAASTSSSRNPEWAAFLIFLVLTPVVVWAVYAGKVRAAGKKLPTRPTRWPKWEMFAATLAYAAWAFALPETPFADLGWYSAAIAAVGVLVVTTVLGLVAPLASVPLDV
jgi:hypothetical protein